MSDKQHILESLRASIATMEASKQTSYDLSSIQQDNSNLVSSSFSNRSHSQQGTVPDNTTGTDDAFSKIVRLVNHREHSVSSLRKRLQQASFEERDIESALAKAQSLGLVDNIRFGNMLTRSRISQGKGRQGIERELIQEGIDPESIEAFREYRDTIAPECEVTQAVALLKKHPPKAKNVYESAYRKLRQKGYDNSTAHEAIHLWMESNPDR